MLITTMQLAKSGLPQGYGIIWTMNARSWRRLNIGLALALRKTCSLDAFRLGAIIQSTNNNEVYCYDPM